MGEIGRCPEVDLGGGHVDLQIGTQLVFYPVGEQPANMVHVHMGKHHIRHGPKIDTGGFQPTDQLAGPRKARKFRP